MACMFCDEYHSSQNGGAWELSGNCVRRCGCWEEREVEQGRTGKQTCFQCLLVLEYVALLSSPCSRLCCLPSVPSSVVHNVSVWFVASCLPLAGAGSQTQSPALRDEVLPSG